MNLFKSPVFRKYFLPGFVFQSVIIAGGYGTGREIVEYFLNFGTLGGLLGMALTTIMWSVVLAVVCEFSRVFRAYDYRTFFKNLLGPVWVSFEIIYVVYLIIVLAVIGSAAGLILRDNFGVQYLVGVVIMFVAVGFLTFKGSGLIEKFLSIWSFLLYAVYGVFFIVAVVKFGFEIRSNISSAVIEPFWALGGFKYALYNLGNIAAIIFCLTHIETRKEAICAGLISGLIGILPAALFFVAVCGYYPHVLAEEMPTIYLLQRIGVPALLVVFQIILFGTLIETGTAFIHSVNERIQSVLRARGKQLPSWQRPIIALVLLSIALAISTFGLIALIAKGYGAASWGFLVVAILPLLTVGVYKILRYRRNF